MLIKADLKLDQLKNRLLSPRCRLRTRAEVAEATASVIKGTKTSRWIQYNIKEEIEETYKQEKPGRQSKNTRYVIRKKTRFKIEWSQNQEAIHADSCSDGIFHLITNCENLPLEGVLKKYKYQPRLEKRHEQLKSVYSVAPVLLKNIMRIEALLFLYFLALLVQVLI